MNISSKMKHGFTIVELLVVIVVIAVIATIAFFGYQGITRHAAEVSLQSDLDTASSQLASVARGGVYPLDGSSLVASPGNTLAYATKPYGYCITASSSKTPKVFVTKSSTLKIAEGDCDTEGNAYTTQLPSGFANGSCSTAQFSFQPTTNGQGGGITWDKEGNAFVADSGNHVIRKITPDCTVSTYAGTVGVAGTTNGSLTSARFNYPVNVLTDSSGNLIVVDRGGGVLRRITPSGTVSTITANVSIGRHGNIAVFNDVIYVSRDQAGEPSENMTHSIAKVFPDGTIEPFVGSGVGGFANGNGSAAQFNSPASIAFDRSGNLYVADSGNNRIRKVTPAGEVSTYAGTGVQGSSDGNALTTATFAGPRSITVDGKGWVYVRGVYYYAGTYNDARIRVITPQGEVRPVYWGNGMANEGMTLPYALAVDHEFNVWTIQSDGASSNIFKVTQ